MKVKYSVIPFIPAFLAMMFLKLMSIFGMDSKGQFMGMNSMNITYTVIGIAVGLFVVCVLINLFDRKTAPVYPQKRNIPAGIFAVLSGLVIVASSVTTAVSAFADAANTENLLITVICAGLAFPSGLALMVMSGSHFSGRSTVSAVSMLFVFPALWGCANLVNEFLQATKASISSKDLTLLFCYIFISLFLFSNSMVLSRIKGRNPVKGLFLYGLPMTALTLTYGAYELVRVSREGFNRDTVLHAAMLICLGLYAISFILEVFSNTYTKDDVEIVENLPGDDDAHFDDAAPKSEPVAENRLDEAVLAEDKVLDKVIEKAEADIVQDVPVRRPHTVESAGEPHVSEAKAETDDYLEAARATLDNLVFTDRPSDSHPNGAYIEDRIISAGGLDELIIGVNVEDDGEPDSAVAEEAAQTNNKNEKRRQERAERRAAKQAEAERKAAEKAAAEQAAAEQAAVEKAADNNMKQNDRQTGKRAKSSPSADMERLSEELRKAAESRRNAEQEKQNRFAKGVTLEEVIRGQAQAKQQNQAAGKEQAAQKDARQSEEDRIAAEQKREEAVRVAEKARKIEEARQLAAKRGQNGKRAEEAKKAEEARLAEEAKRAEEARRAEEAKRAEEARRAEEAKRAEEARLAEEAKRAEEARLAEEAKRAEEARLAEEAKKAEEARLAAAQQEIVSGPVETREEYYREKRTAVDRLLRDLNNKK